MQVGGVKATGTMHLAISSEQVVSGDPADDMSDILGLESEANFGPRSYAVIGGHDQNLEVSL